MLYSGAFEKDVPNLSPIGTKRPRLIETGESLPFTTEVSTERTQHKGTIASTLIFVPNEIPVKVEDVSFSNVNDALAFMKEKTTDILNDSATSTWHNNPPQKRGRGRPKKLPTQPQCDKKSKQDVTSLLNSNELSNCKPSSRPKRKVKSPMIAKTVNEANKENCLNENLFEQKYNTVHMLPYSV